MKFAPQTAWLGLAATLLIANGQDTPTTSATDAGWPAGNSFKATTPAVSEHKLTDAGKIAEELAKGTAKVIVNLTPPQGLSRTDFASKASLENLRPQIKQVQQDVLANLTANDVKERFRFDNIAGFSAEVTAQGLKALQADPRVVSIEPVHVLKPNLAQGIPLMHGMTYRSTYNGAGMAIAICDTGIDYNHSRLGGGGFPNSKVIGGYDFGDGDPNPIPNGDEAHGTACAGIAAGNLGTVGDYIGGVAHNAKLYALKISYGATGFADADAIVAAWDWCVTHKNDNPNYPILVISTSFGGGRYYSACDSMMSAYAAAANNAVAAGITVLASSGNEGYCDSIGSPACVSSVISVGAVYDANFGHRYHCVDAASCAPKLAVCSAGYYVDDLTAADKVVSYANVASFLTLLAPSEDCYTTDISGAAGYSGDDYTTNFNGTSAACPYAAGAVACLQSAAKAITGSFLTPQQVKSYLVSYGDNVTDSKVAITKPRINLERAIQNLRLKFVSATLANGNGDQRIDPNECNALNIAFRNNGNSAVSNLSVTLTGSAPGMTIIESNSAYPIIIAGGIATNTTTFRISTSPAFACGTPVNLSLALSYPGGTNLIPLSLTSGGTDYAITESTGASIVPGITDSGNHGDDVTTNIMLPFPYTLYGQTFNGATLSANGNIQFASDNVEFANACLPFTGFNYAIYALWDDLLTSTNTSGKGILTSTSGTAPNRIFNIEWRATYNGNGQRANFEVRLYEGQERFDLIYGELNGNGGSATVGAQAAMIGQFTEFECNTGGLSNGLQLTFQRGCHDGGGYCQQPTITGQPQNQTNNVGTLASFSVSATGSQPLSYQWRKDGVSLPGATGSSLVIGSVKLMNIGYYSVVISNPVGVVTSANASLTVPGVSTGIWQGLVAYYPFNGNANDESGNGNNGVVHGADWRYSIDRFGEANSLYLNITSTPAPTLDGAYVAAPRSLGLDFNKDFSLCIWISIPGGLPVWSPQNLISNGQDNNGVNIRIISDISPGTDFLQCVWNTTKPSLTDVNAVWPSVRQAWWQIVTVRSGTNVSLFRNGVLLANSVVSSPPSNAPSIWLGRHIVVGLPPGTGAYSMIGGLDDVRMYNRALSSNEVAELYFSETRPILEIVEQGGNVQLSWPAVYGNYDVLGSTTLTGSTWITNTNSRTINGSNISVTLPASTGQMFYRLKLGQ